MKVIPLIPIDIIHNIEGCDGYERISSEGQLKRMNIHADELKFECCVKEINGKYIWRVYECKTEDSFRACLSVAVANGFS